MGHPGTAEDRPHSGRHDESPVPKQRWRTIAFVDLAGFTALTEVHGDEVAADVAERLTALARAALGPQDRVIKTIGDAVMLATAQPWPAVELVRRILVDCHQSPGCPLARAGIHHGPVVRRGDDLFGRTVNLAARVTGQANGGQVLATETVARQARAGGIPVHNLGSFDLRNLSEPVELFELTVHPSPAGGAIDPVCRMHVERATAAGQFHYDGINYWFCSLRCAATFTAHPHRYAVNPGATADNDTR